jgi:feruloyl esterase
MRLLLCFSLCAAAHAAGCEGLKSLALPHTSIDVAEPVPAGKFKPDEGPDVDVTAAFCRVAGRLKPTADSDIRFEVWMPASGWTGKMEGVGNGGFAGSISYAALARLVGLGHRSNAGPESRGDVWHRVLLRYGF